MNNEFNQGSIKEKLQVLQDNMNQSQQQKLSAGDCTISIMRIITCVILFAVLAACLYGLSIGVGYLNFKEKENNVTAGKIIEKKRENGTALRPPTYYLAVEWHYDKNGEDTTGKKYIEVDRDVYLSYAVGDYFDSQDFKVSEQESTE